jgi:acetyl-CoA C-acetyltransferase
MSCLPFGEHWAKGLDDLIVEAAFEAVEDAGVSIDDIQAYWFGTCSSAFSGAGLSVPLKIQYKPVTRVENLCATGTDAFRNGCYAVASGIVDIALVLGAEKLKDSGYSGLVKPSVSNDGTRPEFSLPATFSFLAPAYFKKYGLPPEKGKEVLTRIAWKNHNNGALNPRAQFREAIPMEKIQGSPLVADPLGVMDCSGVADGAAAAVIVRSEDARKFRKDPLYVKAIAMACGPGHGMLHQDYDFTSIRETVHAARDAYEQAGIADPRKAISFAEVHDCFTPTELVLYEDLGFSDRGKAWQDVLNGVFDLKGELPVNPDGGLKSFGHPIGATGLRMLFECYLQLRGQAGPRQIANPRLGLTHNMGGAPWACVSSVCIVGNERD